MFAIIKLTKNFKDKSIDNLAPHIWGFRIWGIRVHFYRGEFSSYYQLAGTAR